MTSYTLSAYEPFEIVLPKPEVPQDLVDQEIDRRLDALADYAVVSEDRTVENGDYIAMTITDTQKNDEPFDMLNGEGLVYHVGSGMMPDAFDKVLVQMKAGETDQAILGMDPEPGSNKMSRVTMSVKVEAILSATRPELTDELVKENFAPLTTVEEFRKSVEDSFELSDMTPDDPNFERVVLNELSDRLVEQPDATTIQREGGIDNARLACALEALADHVGFDSSEDNVINSMPGNTPDEKIATYNSFRSTGHEDKALRLAKEHFARAWLKKNAVVRFE